MRHDLNTRPGKSSGVSAGIVKSKDDTKVFHVFTSSAPLLEEGGNYNPFNLYAILEHAGDREAARADLAKQGYGQVNIPLYTSKQLAETLYKLVS